MKYLALLLLAVTNCSGLEGLDELKELGAMTPDQAETNFAENAGENGPTSLFPGPAYGLPGGSPRNALDLEPSHAPSCQHLAHIIQNLAHRT